MANTIIQIKRSTTTSAPASLNVAEQAYSYLSDKLFIGNTAGTGVIEIGGKYWVDTTQAAYGQANVARDQANTAYEVANNAASSANSNLGAAFTQANTARTHANAAYLTANSAFDNSNAAYVQANTARTHANAAHLTANAAFDQANTARTHANAAHLTANAAYVQANAAHTHANAAFLTANNALPKAGGTITGDLVVQGNATFSGTITYANTQTLLIGDNIFVLNADLPSNVAASEDAGFQVNRGSSGNVGIIWLESTDQWATLNPDGSYSILVTNTSIESANAIAIAAFIQANTARTHANAAFLTANSGFNVANIAYAYANSAHVTANAAYDQANTARTHANAAFLTANSGFNVANISYAHANAAHLTANAAYVQANTARDQANLAFGAANTAASNAVNASALSTGTVPSGRLTGSYTGITGVGTLTAGTWNANTIKVPYGGTGMITFTTNGILYGNAAGDLKVTSAGTEGQVLQASATGVPQFGMLDGGTF